jgi:hypothetical protein
MSETTEKLEMYDNSAAGRYEARIDNRVAVSHYRLTGSTITFTHTQVPEGLEGQGIASQLVRFGLEEARARGLTVISRCSFVSAYIQRHPEYQPPEDDELLASLDLLGSKDLRADETADPAEAPPEPRRPPQLCSRCRAQL